MAEKSPLAQMLEELYSTVHQPYSFRQVWPMLPLFFLRMLSAIGYICSVLGILPAEIYSGMDWVINCLTAVCLFLLIPAISRYRTAAIFMAASIAIHIFSAFLGKPTLWEVLAALCVFTSGFFEYTSHAMVASRQSGRLADRWDRLFLWAFGSIFFSAFVFMLSLVLSYMAPVFSLISVLVSYLPDLLVDLLYLIYMGLTLRLIFQGESTRKKGALNEP